MVPTALGAEFTGAASTVTLKPCATVASPSLAVTVITAPPAPTPLIVTVAPSLVAVATSAFELEAM